MSTMQVWEQLSLLGLCPEEMWGVSKPQQGSRYCTHVMATSPTDAQEILVWGVKTEASPSWGFPVCCVGEKAFRAARNSMEEAPFVCWLGWWHLLTRRHLTLACPGWPTSQVWSWLTTTNPFSAVGKASYKTWSSWQRSRKAGRKHVGWLQAHLVQAPSGGSSDPSHGCNPSQNLSFLWKTGTNSGSGESKTHCPPLTAVISLNTDVSVWGGKRNSAPVLGVCSMVGRPAVVILLLGRSWAPNSVLHLLGKAQCQMLCEFWWSWDWNIAGWENQAYHWKYRSDFAAGHDEIFYIKRGSCSGVAQAC